MTGAPLSVADITPPPWLELQRLVGAGGMGRVFAAIDQRSGQPIAVKTLSHFMGKHLLGFKNEFRALAGVVHSNLVCQHELVEHEGQWFLLMELIEGLELLYDLRGETRANRRVFTQANANDTTFSTRPAGDEVTPSVGATVPADGKPLTLSSTGHRRRQPLTAEQTERALPILRQVALGIGMIHRSGYLHRDIKPSNVLVTPEGRAVVLDFGIAVAKDAATSSGGKQFVVGTPAYLAPELLQGGAPTTASDWYSFGIILFEALSGRRPFESQTIGLERLTQKAPSVELFAPGASEALCTLTNRLLGIDPSERPGFAEVLEALGGNADDAATPLEPRKEGRLIGRRSERLKLHELAEESRRRPTPVFVEGRSGVGKTVLLDDFADSLEASGYTVLEGCCYEHEMVPYKTVDKVVDALCTKLDARKEWVPTLAPGEAAALTRAFPVLRESFRQGALDLPKDGTSRDEPADLQRRAIRALTDVLQFIAARTPLAVLVDDVQWGDAVGAEVLARLSSPSGPPVLVVCGFRSEDSNALTVTTLSEAFRRESGSPAEVIALEPLTANESAELGAFIALEAGIKDRRIVQWALTESEGQPFFLHELLYAAAQNPSLAQPGMGGGLQGVMAKRIERLPAEARELLEAICLAGAAVRTDIAVDAAGVQAQAARALQILRAGHFVRTTKRAGNELVDAYHGKFRDVIDSRLEPERAQLLHSKLVEAWSRLPASEPGRGYALALHATQAGHHVSWQAAYGFCRDAAIEAVATFDSSRARELLLAARTVALNHGAPVSPHAELMLGDACMATHDVEGAKSAFSRVLSQTTDGVVKAGAHAGLAKLFMGSLDTRSALGQLGMALEAMGRPAVVATSKHMTGALLKWLWSLVAPKKQQPNDELVAQLYSMSGLAGYFLLDQRLLVSGMMRGVATVRRLPRGRALAESYALVAVGAGTGGSVRLMRYLLKTANEAAAAAGDPAAMAFVAGFGALAIDMSGDALEGERMGVKAIENGARLDISTFLTVVSSVAWNLSMRGQALRALGVLRHAHTRVLTLGESLVGQGHTYRAAYATTYALMGKVEEGARQLKAYELFLEKHAPSDVFRNITVLGHRTLFEHLTGAPDEAVDASIARHARFEVAAKDHVQTLRHFYVACAARQGDQLLRRPLTPELVASARQTLADLKLFERSPALSLHRALLETKLRWATGKNPLGGLHALQKKAEALAAPWLQVEGLLAEAVWLQRHARSSESTAVQAKLEQVATASQLFGLIARATRVLSGLP